MSSHNQRRQQMQQQKERRRRQRVMFGGDVIPRVTEEDFNEMINMSIKAMAFFVAKMDEAADAAERTGEPMEDCASVAARIFNAPRDQRTGVPLLHNARNAVTGELDGMFGVKLSHPRNTGPKCATCSSFNDITQCSRCTAVFYCGRVCQSRDWSAHKPACVATSTTAAAASK